MEQECRRRAVATILLQLQIQAQVIPEWAALAVGVPAVAEAQVEALAAAEAVEEVAARRTSLLRYYQLPTAATTARSRSMPAAEAPLNCKA